MSEEGLRPDERNTRASERVLAAAGLAVAGLYLWTEGPGPDAWGPWVKPWPVVCLAIWVGREGRGRLGRLVAAGLAVSAVADVVIEWSFLAGLALFLAAHLVYVAAFVADERSPRLLRALPFAAYGVLMFRVLGPGLGTLAWPVALYALAIASMMWRAAARVRPDDRAGWIGLAGALAFGVSDTLLALHRFHAPIAAPLAIIITYWAAQLGIAASAVRPR
jgi:alkenylglycerophosphocholine hydrolase